MTFTVFTVCVFVAWTSVIVANTHTRSVFILQPHGGNYNISFSKDMFERFYRCLRSNSSSSCAVHHKYVSPSRLETTSVTYASKGSLDFNQGFQWTSFCVPITAGNTSCGKFSAPNLKNENGIQYDLACGSGKCNSKCVYINNENVFFIMDNVIKTCNHRVVRTETTNIYKHSLSQPTTLKLIDHKSLAPQTPQPFATKPNISLSWTLNPTVNTVTLTAKNTNRRTPRTKPTVQTTNTPAWTADTPIKEHDKVTSDSGIMIGIIVAIIVVLLIVITIVCLRRRNKEDIHQSCHCSITVCSKNTKTLQNGCSRFCKATNCLTKIRNLRQSSNVGQNRSRGEVPVTSSNDDNISTIYAVPTTEATQTAGNGLVYSKLREVIAVPENLYNVASDGMDKCFEDSAYETVDTTFSESGTGIVLDDGEVEVIDVRNGSQPQEFSVTNFSSRQTPAPENTERRIKDSNGYVNKNVSSSSVPQEPNPHIYFELENEAKSSHL